MIKVFAPNLIDPDYIDELKPWQLKVALLHFAPKRKDCVRFGYTYRLMQSNRTGKEEIFVVGDDDGMWASPIDLSDEVDWDDKCVFLEEYGENIDDYLKAILVDAIKKYKKRKG